MPKEPRGVIRPMSDTTLECCDVIKGKGLFSSDKYISRNQNMKREDRKRGVTHLIRRGEMFEARLSYRDLYEGANGLLRPQAG